MPEDAIAVKHVTDRALLLRGILNVNSSRLAGEDFNLERAMKLATDDTGPSLVH